MTVVPLDNGADDADVRVHTTSINETHQAHHQSTSLLYVMLSLSEEDVAVSGESAAG